MATETLESVHLEEKDLETGQKEEEEEEEVKASEESGKKRGRGKGRLNLNIGGEESKKSDPESGSPNEPVTPVERPLRERKTVERFSDLSSQRVSAPKLSIPKGRGTQLKDIPNVAFKLSKRKPDENLQKLYHIIFGKRGKTKHLKKEIHQFSGFVWVDNEDKQKEKLKERLEKCVKEKLLDFCDVLDIPHKSISKKEELLEKLLDFLESPHATTDVLLEEKEKLRKDKKRKRKGSVSTKTSGKASGKGSSKRKKQTDEVKQKRKRPSEAEEESEDEVVSPDSKSESDEDSDHDMVHKEEHGLGGGGSEEMGKSEEDEEEEEDKEIVRKKKRKVSGKKSTNDPETKVRSRKRTPAKSARSLAEAMESEKGPEESKDDDEMEQIEGPHVSGKKSVKDSIPTTSPEKSTITESGKSPAKPKESRLPSALKRTAAKDDELSASPSKSKGSANKQPKKNEKKPQTLSSKKPSSKSGGKVSVKEQGKKGEPSGEEMHSAVSKILKEVDFNTATLSDIVRQLGTVFGIDLMHRKKEVKGIIEEVMKNMSDEDESADGDEAGDAAEDDVEKAGEDMVGGDIEAAGEDAVKNVAEEGGKDADEEQGKEAQENVVEEADTEAGDGSKELGIDSDGEH